MIEDLTNAYCRKWDWYSEENKKYVMMPEDFPSWDQHNGHGSDRLEVVLFIYTGYGSTKLPVN